jgi:hypothetical protein
MNCYARTISDMTQYITTSATLIPKAGADCTLLLWSLVALNPDRNMQIILAYFSGFVLCCVETAIVVLAPEIVLNLLQQNSASR